MAGLYFEEFSVGQEFRHPLTRTVTEMDNTMFSLLTRSTRSRCTVDAHFAASTEFGQRIFNSLYTLGIMIGMTVYDTTMGTTVANLGMTDVTFPSRSSMATRCGRRPRCCRCGVQITTQCRHRRVRASRC